MYDTGSLFSVYKVFTDNIVQIWLVSKKQILCTIAFHIDYFLNIFTVLFTFKESGIMDAFEICSDMINDALANDSKLMLNVNDIWFAEGNKSNIPRDSQALQA